MDQPKRRPVGNFFGPFFSVKFYEPNSIVADKPDADGVVKISPSNPDRQREIDTRNLQNYAANAVIDIHPGSATLELTLTPPYDDAVDLLETGVIVYGTLVSVKWGYAENNLFQERLFTINQPKVSFGRDIVINISGVDTFSHATRQRTTKSKWDRKQFPFDYELLTALANVTNHTINPFASGVVSLKSTQHPLNIRKVLPIEDSLSDWELFNKICQGNGVVPVPGENNSILLYDRSTIATEKADYNFFWYDQSTLPNDIPMISFVVNPTETIYGPKDAVRKLISHVDADTGQVVFTVYEPAKDGSVSSAGNPQTDKNAFGSQGMDGQKVVTSNKIPVTPNPSMDAPNPNSDGTTNPITFSKTESYAQYGNNALAKLEMYSQDASLQGNTSALITAPGHPDAVPPLNITARGVSKLFNGNYYVISARHSIGTAGYEMTLHAVRTTTHDADNTQVNTKQPSSAPPNAKGGSSNNSPLKK